MAKRFLSSRIALAIALSSGVALTAVPAPAFAKAKDKDKAAKIEFSPEFTKAAADLDKTVSEAKANPAVTAAAQKAAAAKTDAEKQAAAAEVDAALGGAKAKLAAASAAVSTPGDKLKLGDMTRSLGVFYADPAMQHTGLVEMLDSGVLQPEQVGQVQYLAGVTAYQSGDYQGAIQYLKPAMDSGYRDDQGLLGRVLADAYKKTNNPAAAAALTDKAITDARAAGTKPDEAALRSALQAAYDSKNKASAVDYSAELVRDYPSPSAWNSAIRVVRELSSLPPQDNLDLMRLMSRTNAMTERSDYVEYIQNADPRRLPGETLKVIDAGVAAGKLQSSDQFVSEAKQIATGRLSADKASLPGLERDASAGSASAVTVSAAADTFLSYDEPAKAETLYKSALTKPGIDKDRVMTRLGIAQLDQGRSAEAEKTFEQVGGGPCTGRQAVGRLCREQGRRHRHGNRDHTARGHAVSGWSPLPA